jgi:hypothetical protein
LGAVGDADGEGCPGEQEHVPRRQPLAKTSHLRPHEASFPLSTCCLFAACCYR